MKEKVLKSYLHSRNLNSLNVNFENFDYSSSNHLFGFGGLKFSPKPKQLYPVIGAIFANDSSLT